jgi:hypothetical protein
MSCQKVQEQISLMLDRQLTGDEWEQSKAHIRSCRRCDAYLESMRKIRTGLNAMVEVTPPAELSARLHVVASHERARQVARANVAVRIRDVCANIRLYFDNLMRPFAVPVTGGLFSALLLFSILVPKLNSFQRNDGDEPPLAIITDPEGEIVGASAEALRLQPGGATITGSEVSLVLLIDERGHVQDYYLSGGELTDDMKSIVLLSRFTPATIDGQPTWGLKQVVFSTVAHPRVRS